jgi:chemotaxis protein methyltransferase CheR
MDSGGPALSDREFMRIKRRLHDVAGISLSAAKRTLVIARLSRHLRRLGLPSFDAYVDHLESEAGPVEQEAFVNALTTNLTRFWREEHHFDHLSEHLPALVERRRRAAGGARPRLRIWSAGCSTGQEPYTIALAALAACPELGSWDFRILATDIDTAVLARASEGVFAPSELSGLSPGRRAGFKHLEGGGVQVPAAARRLVTFKPLNLVGSWPMRGPFDAIFCRNVAIYFDRATQSALFARLGAMLAEDGFLYIGHSENITDHQAFRLVGKTIYQRAPAIRRSAA